MIVHAVEKGPPSVMNNFLYVSGRLYGHIHESVAEMACVGKNFSSSSSKRPCKCPWRLSEKTPENSTQKSWKSAAGFDNGTTEERFPHECRAKIQIDSQINKHPKNPAGIHFRTGREEEVNSCKIVADSFAHSVSRSAKRGNV